jgi:hypothetical protein
LAIDDETGFLYVTAENDTLHVYNTLTWPSDPCYVETNGVYDPAGMCLGGNVEYKPPLFSLVKDNNDPNNECVEPYDPDKQNYLVFDILWDTNGHPDMNLVMVDQIPDVLDYNSSTPASDYNSLDRTVKWNISGDSGHIVLKTQVNRWARPCSAFTNTVVMEGDTYLNEAKCDVNVCPWGTQIIYVDIDANGYNNGTNWNDAYNDLQDAISQARSCGSEIWVAGGTYTSSAPDPYYEDPTFPIVDGIPLYGHFAGSETSLSQRNLKDPGGETILNGAEVSSWYVVTAYDLNQQNILDGFTITGGSDAGVKIDNANLAVSNCLIDSNGNGIDALESGFSIINCTIQNNVSRGIYADFSYNQDIPETRIENNIICNNSSDGIYLDLINSSAKILNNIIHDNGNSGISLFGISPDITIRNNTIVRNGEYGIFPSINVGPDVNNCIIKGHTYEYYWYDYNETFIATYSCIRLDGSNDYNGEGNIHSDPCFVDEDANNFHLKPASDCIDAGDPNFNDFNEFDIDGECRILFGKTALRVDMGADEVYWPKADFDQNGIVNFIDFAFLANDWQEPESDRSLDADTDVDIYDLAQFCEDWLWIAPWSELYGMLMGQSGGDMGMPAGSESESQVSTEDIPSDETSEIIDQPMSDEQIQELIDWTEELWESSPDLRAMVDPNDYQRVLESLRDQLDD